MNISEEKFEEMMGEVIDNLPDKFKEKLHNVAILAQDFPTTEQMKKVKAHSEYSLLGLYEGHVQSRRLNFGAVLPDKITIFRVPIMQSCKDEEECRQRVENTLRHEIAHHFGSDEKGARKAGQRKA